jgi:hypothetical protein
MRMPQIHGLADLPGVWKKYRVAPMLALVLALAALFASSGQHPGAASHSSATTRALPAAAAAPAYLPATHLLIGSADLHIDSSSSATDANAPGDEELEVNLTISQTQSDCQTPLYGAFCLRYNILIEDAPTQAGYGLIPVSDVTVSGSTVTLRVDTRHEPRLIRTAGAGGMIVLTWRMPAGMPRPALHTTGVAAATVQGRMVGYVIPANGVLAGVLMYGGA